MNKIIITLFFLFIVLTNVNAQELSQETKTRLLSEITSQTSSTTLDSISVFKVVEAIPLLEQHFWKQDIVHKYFFLEALDELDAQNMTDFCNSFLDSIKENKYKEDGFFIRSRTETALLAFQLCFKRNNYDKVEYFFDFLDGKEIGTYYYDNYLDAMEELLQNDQYKVRLQPYFENFIKKNKGFRWFSKEHHVEKYANKFKEESLPLVKYLAINDDSASTREYLLAKVLSKFNKADFVNFMRERLILEKDEYIKDEIIYNLLFNYQSPNNYKLVKEQYDTFSNEIRNSLRINDYNEYTPRCPKKTLELSSILDTLSSYNNQCLTLNWLGNISFSSQLLNLISDAKTKLNSGDSLGTAIKIKQYQSLITQARKDSLANRFVTEDGYKFLYYYPQYILERLPKIPTVKLKDSNGILLPGSSLQYYDGSWKDAANNNDGTFSSSVRTYVLDAEKRSGIEKKA